MKTTKVSSYYSIAYLICYNLDWSGQSSWDTIKFGAAIGVDRDSSTGGILRIFLFLNSLAWASFSCISRRYCT